MSKNTIIRVLSIMTLVGPCGREAVAADAPTASIARTFGTAQSCADLAKTFKSDGATIVSAEVRSATVQTDAAPALPAHCEVIGAIDERTGSDGLPYAIKFHMRIPIGEAWNGRFVFSGGGGSNGELGNAMTVNGTSVSPLAKGWAVLSQNAGHDNAIDDVPEKGGIRAFGFEFRARQDNWYRSHGRATAVAKDVIKAFAGNGPTRSYFAGCSKGGQEAGMVSQRYPDLFDGIVMGDPLLNAPMSSNVRPAWIAQVFGRLARDQGLVDRNGLPFINKAFTDTNLAVLRNGVTQQCDALDGVQDGMSQDFRACSAKFKPSSLRCAPGQSANCLDDAHVTALEKMMGSYPGDNISWDYDLGLVEGMYRSWWLGKYDSVQSGNLWIGRAGATLYVTPPHAVHATLNNGSEPYRYFLDFNFGTDIAGSFASTADFPESSWDQSFVGTDLSAFRAHGGKMLVYHGASDGAFPIGQTAAWVEKINAANGGDATSFLRFYSVPGMGHCGGGPATSSFDMLTAVQEWVENGKVPEMVLATAPSGTPWPGRTRPLCTWPRVARYISGDVENASSFRCE
ncbi:tannase/feruloyl esterase family alpha/beta hydrolase [Bradyrhizobium mercantei]|uniref:tannase/feruloyl esterase family alpha/beta hydrolase n=1 Tax=Bradyrhizobium mercantei TaxID=1904807 RepID=UPI0009781B3A|nr:tannase/feruloyl esterase family alpha/beta hydrolase [Bradyrhizobium mercantei]